MAKFIILIAVGFSIWLWQNDKLPFFAQSSSFDDSGKPAVIVFTYDDCGAPCQDSVDELNRRKVSFQEVNVNPNDEESAEYQSWVKMGKSTTFPLVIAGKERNIGYSKSQLATLLGNNFGDLYLTGAEKRYFKAHFAADGSPKVVLYGTDWCPSCAKLREEFKQDGQEYVDIDVEKRDDTDHLLRVMEIPGYPATWVGYTRAKGPTLSDVKSAMR